MTPHEYRVGQPYSQTGHIWPEAVDYNWRAGAHELRLFLGSPTRREVDDIARGPAEFALLVKDDVLVLLYRFGTAIPWSDAPYSWHLVRNQYPDEATIPEPAEVQEPHDILNVILVDANTGIIWALRAVTFSPAFTTAIRLAIREQAARPWPGEVEYKRQIQALYAQYPTSEAMLKDASCRTVGGR